MTDATFSRPGAVDLSSLAQAAPAAAAGGFVIDLTEATFQEVAGSSMQYPVILAFHSAHDPQGAAVGETLASLVNAAGGRFLLARVDVDAEPRLAQGLGVQGVPTVVALIGGQMAPLFQGTRAADEIAALLDQVAQLAVANGITGRAQPVAPRVRSPQASIRVPMSASNRSLPAGASRVTLPGRPSRRAGVGTASPHMSSRLTKLV